MSSQPWAFLELPYYFQYKLFINAEGVKKTIASRGGHRKCTAVIHCACLLTEISIENVGFGLGITDKSHLLEEDEC